MEIFCLMFLDMWIRREMDITVLRSILMPCLSEKRELSSEEQLLGLEILGRMNLKSQVQLMGMIFI